MPNTSATGGYLQPASTATPVADLDLDLVVQALVAGVTGLPGDRVRPRWQPTQPRMPEITVDWCAVGVTVTDTERGTAYINHDGTAEGHDDLVRHEQLEVLASFYGPSAVRNAALLRDGLQIAQNRAALDTQGMAFVEAGPVRTVPELVNEQWLRRCDLSLTLRRVVRREYPVLNILSAPVSITP